MAQLRRSTRLFRKTSGALSDAANPDKRDPRHARHARRKFRPVVGIMPVKDDAEAIALMNDSDLA